MRFLQKFLPPTNAPQICLQSQLVLSHNSVSSKHRHGTQWCHL